MTIVRGCC